MPSQESSAPRTTPHPDEDVDDPAAIAADPAFVLPTRAAWWAATEPDRPFITEVDGDACTYGEFGSQVARWGAVLAGLGVRPHDRVLTMVPSSIDAFAIWLALGNLGAIEVPVDPGLNGSFLSHVLTDPGARLCLLRPEFAPAVEAAGVTALEIVPVPRDRTHLDGVEPWYPSRPPGPDDPACVIYTSGTTGASKGVVIGWGQMSATIGRIPRHWLSGSDAVYAYHPMFHVTGRSPLPSMLDVGGRIVCRERLSVQAFWNDVRAHGCTTSTVNTALLSTSPPRSDDRDHPLRVAFCSGGRPTALRFQERFGVRLVECYGSTEVGFPIVNRDLDDGGLRSCGVLRPGYSARIVEFGTGDEPGSTGVDVADGLPGELWIRPPHPRLITSGYLGRPDLTASAMVDGWYRTGDRLVRHPDGRFVFVDRLKDTIRRLGENISATALEAVVAEHSAVSECCAVGIDHPVTGQEIFLAVIASAGRTVHAEEIHAHLLDRVPRHMRPSAIAVVDDLPRTATNKILRRSVDAAVPADRRWTPPGR